jgi:hypothetical protein
MCAESDRRIAFAETCRSRAAMSCSPFRRQHLLVLANLCEQEAELVQQSYDRITESKGLIVRSEILLHRR